MRIRVENLKIELSTERWASSSTLQPSIAPQSHLHCSLSMKWSAVCQPDILPRKILYWASLSTVALTLYTNSDMGSEQVPDSRSAVSMNVGIIGAGIAGLGAAVALTRAGHHVEIFEKSSFKNEIGAAILITPNATRILREWGFDFERAGPVDFKQFRFIKAHNGEVEHREDFSGVEQEFGSRMCAFSRVDLHRGIRELVEGLGIEIYLGAGAEDLDIETGIVDIKGQGKVKKDFWVLADGCHSRFVSSIAQENIPTHKVGKSVCRWLAPMSKVIEHPENASLWNNQPPGFCTFFNEKILLVTYPCRGGELLNCAVFHDTRPDEREKDGWHGETTHEKVLETLEGTSDGVRHLPMTVDQSNLRVYTVTQRPPSSTIHRGNFLCIGDTTHHMLPTHAQGGASSLEDAATLEIFFGPSFYSHNPENLEKRLDTYQKFRCPRSATTQILSSTFPHITMEGLAKKEEEIRSFYQGELVDWPKGCGPWSKEIRDFFYAFDVFEEAEKAMDAEYRGVSL
ncbi:FAD/NAD(P)-binding domain-containing protein [Periconia macrospinosa]|uniref:FAD/NAD(P)-binding domain-containing protein n=1 Tax=Periconia macrospinosa TaxID=97972 RepID=A0A2V1E5Y1_9PLEO|nr:FAD/NAD(P)-binding domain-containing protein [Periconia macrospinosa]